MVNSAHQQTLNNAIRLLDVEIKQQRLLLESLVEARSVLELYTTKPVSSFENVVMMFRHEVEDLLGIKTSSLNRYTSGKVPKGKPPFPKPVNKLGHKLLYSRSEVLAWKEALVHG